MKYLCYLLLIGSLMSCEDDGYIISENYNDKTVFEGVFIRSTPYAKYKASNISITFEKDTFMGTSSEDSYPAICEGTFKLADGIIEFENRCLWTADFDWTLILSGGWVIDGNLDELTLTKKSGDNTDTYFLKRKP